MKLQTVCGIQYVDSAERQRKGGRDRGGREGGREGERNEIYLCTDVMTIKKAVM